MRGPEARAAGFTTPPHHTMATCKFQVGTAYSGRFIGDCDSVFTVKILQRTAKTVTIIGPKGMAKHRISHDHEGGETIFPFGTYSMAPVCRAARPAAS